MTQMLLQFLLMFFYVIYNGYCANILYVIPFPGTSHYYMLRPIGLELARRGHNVTVITTVKETDHPPNYHQIIADEKPMWDLIQGGRRPLFTMAQLSAETFHSTVSWPMSLASTEIALNSSSVQKFLREDQKFDIVIAELFFLDAWYALAHKYNAPLVLVTTMGNCMRHNFLTRNPMQLPMVNSEFLTVEQPDTFLGRLRNIIFLFHELLWWRVYFVEKQEELVRKYIPNLPEPVPSLVEMQSNASLTLLNSHFSFDTPTAYVPNMVEIGGIHLNHDFKPLPEDLQKILDKSMNGVVYVSFGSNVKSSELPMEKKNAFLNVFKRLKYTVLWKWEEDNLKDKPDNVIIRKWFPQKEILSHPNVRLFVGHGGLIGTQEAVFHGVPIVGVPIYSDQYNNLLQIQEAGMGRLLKYVDINEKNLETALRTVLEDDSYRVKAKEMSARFQDRPMSALDTAMFWIEYVIRNKGATFMKNPALKLHWFLFYMLDIVLLFLLIIALFLLFLVKCSRFLTQKRLSLHKKTKHN